LNKLLDTGYNFWYNGGIVNNIPERETMKEYRKLIKALKKLGFKVLGNGNHHFVEKNGVKVTITQNIRNATVMIKEVQKQYESSKYG